MDVCNEYYINVVKFVHVERKINFGTFKKLTYRTNRITKRFCLIKIIISIFY